MDHREIAFENIPVTEESIETVPHTDYFSEELNEKYRKINIELLKMVKNQGELIGYYVKTSEFHRIRCDTDRKRMKYNEIKWKTIKIYLISMKSA